MSDIFRVVRNKSTNGGAVAGTQVPQGDQCGRHDADLGIIKQRDERWRCFVREWIPIDKA
jgi:hypothetical protein